MTAASERPVDLLVVSTACHTAVNRTVYKLFIEAGRTVVLVVPEETTFSGGAIRSDPPAPDDPPIVFLKLGPGHARTARFAGITEVLDRHRPGLVLIDNDPLTVMALEIGRWARKNRIPHVCLSCENIPLGFSSLRRRGWKAFPAILVKRLMLPLSKRLVDGVFTINNEGTEIFRGEGYRAVEKIPLGFDPKLFRIDPEACEAKRKDLKLDGIVIGLFGRIIFEKGVHVLVAALERLKEYEWTLMMDEFTIYKTPYADEIRRRLENAGLMDRVVFVSPSHKEMGEYINVADVVVMPSVSTAAWSEQYGRIAAEAMACGKVVVASASGALPMLLGGHGVLVPEGDVDALTGVLKERLVTGSFGSHSKTPAEMSEYAYAMLSVGRQMQEMTRFLEAIRR